MHPLLLRRLRPVAAVVLVFFSWFSIEPWNVALAAQSSPTPRTGHASASQQKPQTAPEVFEANLRSIKEQVRAVREGEAFQAQLAGLLKSLDHAVAQSGRELEASRQAVDQLARAIEQGAPSQDAIKTLQTQQQTLKAAVGQVRLNTSGIEGLLRGMALPAGLTQSENRAKEAVTALVKAFDAALTAMTRRAEQQRAVDSQEHQAFLAASMALDQGLAAFHVRVQALAKEATPERRRAQLWEEAFSKRNSLLLADREIRKEFAETEAFLKEKGLPQEILDRHEAAVGDYETNFNQLKGYFTQVDQAHRAYVSATERGNETAAQAAERDLESKLTAFDNFLKANVKDPPHQHLDPNNLPHRTPKPQERKPRLKKEEFAEFQPQIRLAYNGDPVNLRLAQANPDVPTPEDLAETIEVQFTPEIQALAAELEHNPVKIYNWVRNNIDFVPTYGSIQGAQMCLLTKQCNDTDTASLLIALLRTSGIAARYAIGTIEVPIEQVMNWVGGFTDERAALNFIANAGTPITGLVSGGRVAAARMEHVWVEAYTDYVPSRGATQKEGDTWIPIDGSFKQFTFTGGIDLGTVLPFDSEGFRNQLQSTAVIDEAQGFVANVDTAFVETTFTGLQTELQDYLAANLPDSTPDDLVGGKAIQVQELTFLPGVLPYRAIVTAAKMTALSDPIRHKFTIEVTSQPSLQSDLKFIAHLSEVVGRRVTLSYVPATAEDQQTVASYGGLYVTPPYLIRVKPQLKVEGLVRAEGAAVSMGVPQGMTMEFSVPNAGLDRVQNDITAGGYYAVGLTPDRLPFEYSSVLQQRAQELEAFVLGGGDRGADAGLGEQLYLSAMTYFWEVDLLSEVQAARSNVIYAKLPAEGVFALSLLVHSLLGVPKLIEVTGTNIDVDRDVYVPFSKSGDSQFPINFMRISGSLGSATEHAVIEQVYGGEGISAAKALRIANAQGLKTYRISISNLDAVLPILEVSSEVKTDIRNAVNEGKEVIIPERELQFNQWSGVGYVIADPLTGAAGYIISGGLGGAWETIKKSFNEILDKLDRIDDLIACLVLNNNFLYTAVAVVVFIFLFPGPTPFHTVVYLGIIIIGILVLGQMVFQCASQARAPYLRKRWSIV